MINFLAVIMYILLAAPFVLCWIDRKFDLNFFDPGDASD